MSETMDAEALGRAVEVVVAAPSVAALTGAGVSAESGVPTFRGAGGLWKNYRAEEVATPEAFARDPALVWEFYHYRCDLLAKVAPNPAHRALAELESLCADFCLVTQNVDGLHQQAGSREVLEVHGSIWHVRCTECGRQFDRRSQQLDPLPRCQHCGGLLRPGVVWFGEGLPMDVWAAAEARVRRCACLLVVGTSALVHPAAGLAWVARGSGAQVIEINLEATPASELAAIRLYGPAGKILPELVRKVKSRKGNS